MSVNQQSQTNLSDEEMPADLSQNQDEVSDLQLVFGALGGLRSADALDAVDKSNKKYDDVNHRLYEHRMQEKFGVPEGEEMSEEDGETGHQVWVRSPVHHHHYQEEQKPAVSPPTNSQSQQQPTGVSKAGLAAAVLAAGVGGYALNKYLVPGAQEQPAPVVVPADTDSTYKIEKWTP